MSLSDDLVYSATRAVVQTTADTVGHVAASATHVIATPTRAVANAASAVAVSAATLLLFGAAKLTIDGVFWIGEVLTSAASTAAYAGYSALFAPAKIQYIALSETQKPENNAKNDDSTSAQLKK